MGARVKNIMRLYIILFLFFTLFIYSCESRESVELSQLKQYYYSHNNELETLFKKIECTDLLSIEIYQTNKIVIVIKDIPYDNVEIISDIKLSKYKEVLWIFKCLNLCKLTVRTKSIIIEPCDVNCLCYGLQYNKGFSNVYDEKSLNEYFHVIDSKWGISIINLRVLECQEGMFKYNSGQ